MAPTTTSTDENGKKTEAVKIKFLDCTQLLRQRLLFYDNLNIKNCIGFSTIKDGSVKSSLFKMDVFEAKLNLSSLVSTKKNTNLYIRSGTR